MQQYFVCMMTRRTIRIFVVLSLASVLGIVIMQVYWFKKAFDNSEREFNNNLNIALKEVVRSILKYNNTASFPGDPVRQLDHNYYAVMVNDQINADVLEHYLRVAFDKFNVRQSFEYSIYDCANEKVVYGGYVEGNDESASAGTGKLPEWQGENYYFTVYFPHQTAGILGQMNLWIFSSAVLLVVVIFFSYSLFVILKQRRLSEIQRDFINNMTHEIKTPVSIISVSAETLKDPAIVEHPQRLLNYATIIMDEASRLKNQVERVLSVADDQHRMELKQEEIDMHALIREVTDKIVCNISTKDVALTYHLEATKYTVKGDRLHLANLISNLVDNAIKYGKEKVRIDMRSASGGREFELAVADDGIGIDKADQKKIFEKFYRVPTGNLHNVKGFGIGLNYVQIIARMHKGSVKVSSVPGQGSVFSIILPLA